MSDPRPSLNRTSSSLTKEELLRLPVPSGSVNLGNTSPVDPDDKDPKESQPEEPPPNHSDPGGDDPV